MGSITSVKGSENVLSLNFQHSIALKEWLVQLGHSWRLNR